jgi:chorismate mutase
LTYTFSNPLPRYADEINCNGAVMAAYLSQVLPAITEEGDDNNYGSTVLNDVAALQALSKRIHFGKFVAEAKWRAQPHLFERAVAAGDADAVLAALTYPEQEAAVAARVARKAAGFVSSIEEAVWGETPPPPHAGEQAPCLVTPATVSRLWTELVMPLTKQVQVAYLMRRLEATQLPGEKEGTFAEGQARGRGPIGGFM